MLSTQTPLSPHASVRPRASLRDAVRRALLAGFMGVAGCWQRQRLGEDPSCAQLPIARGQNREWRPRLAHDSFPGLIGEVVQSRGDSALTQALVIIRSERDSIQLLTDSDGRFRAALRERTPVRLDIRRIGYDRVVIPSLPLQADSLLRVRMDLAPLDGACSGFAVILTRRAWWRLW